MCLGRKVFILLCFACHFAYANMVNPFVGVSDEQLQAQTFVINYLPLAEVKQWFVGGKASLLSKQGMFRVDKQENKIWVYDAPKVLARVSKLLRQMDVPARQVIIKAKIIDVDSNYVNQLGGVLGKVDADSAQSWGVHMSSSHSSIITIPILNKDQLQLNYKLEALIRTGHAKLVAEPTIIAINREAADIEAGEEVPYQEQSGTGNTSATFKKAVLRLQVTPTVLPQRKVKLLVHINQDQLSGQSFNGVPAIQTQQLATQAVVASGNSLVLGGIKQRMHGDLRQGVPWLRHIPLLGHLLSSHEHKSSQQELVVLITPRVSH